MSMKELLSSDCGQLNPVLKTASHFAGSGSSGGDGAIGAVHLVGRPGQDFASPMGVPGRPGETLLPPTTFRMDSLLKEIQALDGRSYGPTQAPRVADLTNNADWVREFRSSELPAPQGLDQKWVDDFQANGALHLDRAWEGPIHHMPPPEMGMTAAYPHHPIPMPMHQQMYSNPVLDSAQDVLEDSKWINDFEQQHNKTELMATAEDFLNSMSDPTIKATEFMTFVEKLSTGETTLNQNAPDADQWAREFEAQPSTSEHAWATEFGDVITADSEAMNPSEREQFWQKLQNEWEKAASESEVHPWLSETPHQFEEPYRFEDENPYRDLDDPLEQGKRKLLSSEIPAAALLFESAVQKDPANPEAWYLLGSTQALNEQDPLAISALTKCLELQPDNLKAAMTLAACLTNESYHLQACRMLKTWLKQNPKYSDLVPEEIEKPSLTSSMLPSGELGAVQNLYIKAARKSPAHNLDPDVQCGLGILFNLASDYDKAADCFQAAVNADPNNALLWNRLGATLANGGKSPEAIGAYSKALEIIPGFIRTRYNLGIACVNLGVYQEAAEHFLSALNLQAASKISATGSNGRNNMSDSIWTSLRMVLHLLEKGKLSAAIDRRDLQILNQEFGIS